MRLPGFLMELSPVGETLAAIEAGGLLLEAETAGRNAQLSVGTAENGLSLWEKDYAQPSAGDIEARRARIRAALAGGQTLTPAALAALAITVGRGDRSRVVENAAESHVTLYVEFHGWMPESMIGLEEAVERLKPAHLAIDIVPQVMMQGKTTHYAAMMAKMHLIVQGQLQNE